MNDEWYFVRDGGTIGPLSFDALRQLARQKKLTKADYVGRRGLGRWIVAGTVENLFESARGVPDAVSENNHANLQAHLFVIEDHRLVTGQHDVDLRGVTRIDVTRSIPGSAAGALTAFVASLLFYSVASLLLVCLTVVFVDGVFSALAYSIGLLRGPTVPAFFTNGVALLVSLLAMWFVNYASFCAVLLPATNIWNPDKGDYLLALELPTGRLSVAVSDQIEEIMDIAKKLQNAARSSMQIRFIDGENPTIHFLRKHLPLYDRTSVMMLRVLRYLESRR